jgi:hypothetical protein
MTYVFVVDDVDDKDDYACGDDRDNGDLSSSTLLTYYLSINQPMFQSIRSQLLTTWIYVFGQHLPKCLKQTISAEDNTVHDPFYNYSLGIILYHCLD